MLRMLKAGAAAGLFASAAIGFATLPLTADAAPQAAKKAAPAKGAAMKGGAMKSGAMKGGAMKAGAAKGAGKGGDPLNAAAGKKM